VIFKDTQIDI